MANAINEVEKYKLKIKSKNSREYIEVKYENIDKFAIYINYDIYGQRFMEEPEYFYNIQGLLYHEFFILIMTYQEV